MAETVSPPEPIPEPKPQVIPFGDLPLEIPQGYRLRRTKVNPQDLFDNLLIWQPPRPHRQYVVSVDVSDGLGLDRSVIEVIQVGSMADPDEEVAQFVTSAIDPVALVPYVDAIGRMYKWSDYELPAMVAIECNGHGLVTQTELNQHYGYNHLYIWRHEDAINPKSRFTRSYGWYTNRKTRPIILARLMNAIGTVDPLTKLPDLRINSPITLEELRDFQTQPGEPLWMACAPDGGHDDCVMAAAIGNYVAYTLRADEMEPVHERRRRLHEERVRREHQAALVGNQRPDFQNMDYTVGEMENRLDEGEYFS